MKDDKYSGCSSLWIVGGVLILALFLQGYYEDNYCSGTAIPVLCIK
jgi:hypothetical protein